MSLSGRIGDSLGIRRTIRPAGQAKSNEVLEYTNTVAAALQSVAKMRRRVIERFSPQPKIGRDIKLRI